MSLTECEILLRSLSTHIRTHSRTHIPFGKTPDCHTKYLLSARLLFPNYGSERLTLSSTSHEQISHGQSMVIKVLKVLASSPKLEGRPPKDRARQFCPLELSTYSSINPSPHSPLRSSIFSSSPCRSFFNRNYALENTSTSSYALHIFVIRVQPSAILERVPPLLPSCFCF